MRRFWLPVVVVLVLAPGMTRAIDAGGDAGGSGDDGAAAASSDEAGGGFGAFLDALFAAPPARATPSEVEFVRAFTDRWGVPCREYVQRVLIAEDPVEASGTVCRAADGSWTLRE
jgi:hypothetical protein